MCSSTCHVSLSILSRPPLRGGMCPMSGSSWSLAEGPQGVAAIDALRQGGYTGRLMLLSEESHLPYDRPVLSKNLSMAAEPESLVLRSAEHFETLDVEVLLGTTVTKLDAAAKEITIASGAKLRYDAALVATGAAPRALPVPGGSLVGVSPLRSVEDAAQIASACPSGKRVVVVGSSFVGMEVAATLQRRGCSVKVLGMEEVPFERLGKKLGAAIKKFFETKGVEFMGLTTVKEIKQVQDGLHLTLASGKSLRCDHVVVGVGVVPSAGFVEGVEKASDGSIVVNECLQGAPGLFAAGDVATFERLGQRHHIEHWEVATSQGRVAAANMLGKQTEFDQAPFFWTSIFGKNLRFAGSCDHFDEVIVEGSLEKLNFVACYCVKGEVRAVATMARDPVAVAAGELLRLGKMPSAAQLREGTVSTASFVSLLQQA